MKTNVRNKEKERTHMGAVASKINPEQQLRRSVMSCMLWEDTFYEDGETVAERIKGLVPVVGFEKTAALAIEAREKMKLRHVPLLLARELARMKAGAKMGDLLARIIQRADELAEFLGIYWKDGKCPLSKQVKAGLAKAFCKFNEYGLAKYNGDGAIKLRDVLFLCHAKPADDAQAALWKRLIDGKLETPDTWEVQLSAGKDKKATFERLMDENKLFGLAFLRNLRNMKEAGVPKSCVLDYGSRVDLSRVLPFRFISAARAVPHWEDVIEPMFLRCTQQAEKLPGKTIVIVDVSGSMAGGGSVSRKSDLTRLDAAGALAAILREVCEECCLYATAGDDDAIRHATAAVPARRGFALVDLFASNSFRPTLGRGGIFLTQVMDWIADKEHTADRVIVLTDEQDCDKKCTPDKANAFGKRNYLINVSAEKNGIAYSKFVHINGWSEAIVDYIRAYERGQ